MAVAEMSVMTLVGLERDKSAVLDALQSSAAAQLRSAKDYVITDEKSNSTGPVNLTMRTGNVSTDEIVESIDRVEKAIATVTSAVDELPKNERPLVEKDGFGATKEEFFGLCDKKEEFETLIEEIESLSEKRAEIKAKTAATQAEIRSYEPYAFLNEPFSSYSGTKKAVVHIGLVGNDKLNAFLSKCADNGYIAEVFGTLKGQSTVAVMALRTDKKDLEGLLSQSGFTKCPFAGDTTARAETERLSEEVAALRSEDERLHQRLLSYVEKVRDLKLYSDYLCFIKEKAVADELIGKTQATYLLEAYVPTEATDAVKQAVERASSAVYVTFEKVPRSEFAPTLNKNGKVVSNFEVVTNMYSSPAYGALDPNAVMSFFFALFMGVIMADVGYGLLMIVGGLVFATKQRKGTSVYRMAKVFAVGGIFAIVFGAVFDSWLGFPLLRKMLGEGYNAFYTAHLDQIASMTNIMGISVPAILMWCLALGTAQIGVGLVLKAVQCFGRGKILEGIFGGLVWAIAMYALIFWVYGLATGTEPLATYAMYVLVGSVAIGVLTAGIGERGFGIFTKTFSSAYGLINYVSDILSYARLYGLMLSGAQIASIFTNTLAIGMLFPQGVVGVIFGVILIIVGNVFNLAINLLGAYIHDARLQYVEFFGKFYEGEGELFTPFGNKFTHSYFES